MCGRYGIWFWKSFLSEHKFLKDRLFWSPPCFEYIYIEYTRIHVYGATFSDVTLTRPSKITCSCHLAPNLLGWISHKIVPGYSFRNNWNIWICLMINILKMEFCSFSFIAHQTIKGHVCKHNNHSLQFWNKTGRRCGGLENCPRWCIIYFYLSWCWWESARGLGIYPRKIYPRTEVPPCIDWQEMRDAGFHWSLPRYFKHILIYTTHISILKIVVFRF